MDVRIVRNSISRIAAVILLLAMACRATAEVAVVDRPNTGLANDFYVGNRDPLLRSPFIKLPFGSIKPAGWLRRQLELEAEGFTGHLNEISGYCRKKANVWLDESSEYKNYESLQSTAYWLRGFCALGYVLDDERIIKESQSWFDGILTNQDPDGWIGPAVLKTGQATSIAPLSSEFYPTTLLLYALRLNYEYTRNDRVLEALKKYMRWQLELPIEQFPVSRFHHQRMNNDINHIYWLYNRTAEAWLLKLAEKFNSLLTDWYSGIGCHQWHGVNIAECFRGPGIFYQQSGDCTHLTAVENNYRQVMDIYGQVPGGMFGADECCREGYTGPRQGAETCTMVEFMYSDQILLTITGNPVWADRCEDVAFNSFPASMTADFKTLHYLTAPNMVQCDRENKSPGLLNPGTMLAFAPLYKEYHCCLHNSGFGWPNYAEHLWLATPGNGLAAVLYADSQVAAKVGDGTTVTISQKTWYPFDENVQFKLSLPKNIRFPLYLRVPKWCNQPQLKVNNKAVSVESRPQSYILIDRVWTDGDMVTMYMPMDITITKWHKNKNCVSVNRGPLTYSLKIGEKYVRSGGTDKWPAWDVFATTAWNYGLVLDEKNPSSSFKVIRADWPADEQPFEADAVPIRLTVKAKKILGWKKDSLGLAGKMQQSPVLSNEPIENIVLIPMGSARLRISAFPTIGSGPDAHEWIELAESSKL